MILTKPRPSARILIASNLRLFSDASKRILEPEFAIVGIVSNGRDLMDAVSALKPDIILLDADMSPLDGLEAGSQIKKKYRSAKLIFLSGNISPQMVAEAFRRGAFGYVTKQSPAPELLHAIRKVNRGESYLSPLVAPEIVTHLLGIRKPPVKRITTRQFEILHLLAEGKTMKQVAAAIDVRPTTVQFHKYKMMDTLNVKTNAELLSYAFKHQMRSLENGPIMSLNQPETWAPEPMQPLESVA
jgi:DNA-binding NarL/FixJ family response regulator